MLRHSRRTVDEMTNTYEELSSRVIDFIVAPPGWKLVYLTMDADDDPGFFMSDLPGWLLKEEVVLWGNGTPNWDSTEKPQNRERYVVAAELDGADLIEAPSTNLWCVIGPTDPPLTAEAAAAEKKDRLEHKERLQRLREEREKESGEEVS
jgi:hypothetical protein